jgi:type II secretion system protein N
MDKPILIRRLSFAAYFVVVFLFFLFLLFPFDRVKSLLESEVRQRTPLELSVARISPRFFNYFVLSGVVVSDKQGKVLFETPAINTSISLLRLLLGGFSLDMKARAYSGELFVKVQQRPGREALMVDANGLDLASYALLKNAGIKLTGKVGGNFEIVNQAGKGRFWLKGVTSRELKVQGFPVPDLDFDKGWVEVDLKGDRLMIKKLELDGRELKIQASGDLVLRERGTLNISVRIKPSERLLHEQSTLFSLLTNRDAEGYFLVTLGGMLSQPMPRF